jgi:hypothetical protein
LVPLQPGRVLPVVLVLPVRAVLPVRVVVALQVRQRVPVVLEEPEPQRVRAVRLERVLL